VDELDADRPPSPTAEATASRSMSARLPLRTPPECSSPRDAVARERPVRFGRSSGRKSAPVWTKLFSVQDHASLEPFGVRIGAGHDEQVADRTRLRFSLST